MSYDIARALVDDFGIFLMIVGIFGVGYNVLMRVYYAVLLRRLRKNMER